MDQITSTDVYATQGKRIDCFSTASPLPLKHRWEGPVAVAEATSMIRVWEAKSVSRSRKWRRGHHLKKRLARFHGIVYTDSPYGRKRL